MLLEEIVEILENHGTKILLAIVSFSVVELMIIITIIILRGVCYFCFY